MLSQSMLLSQILSALIAILLGGLPAALAQDETKPAAKGRKSAREQALEWVRGNQAPGYNILDSVRKHLDGLPVGQPDFQFEIGSDLVKSGKATWLLGWRRQFFVFELSAAQSRAIDKNAMTKTALSPHEDLGELRTDFEISIPVFDGGATLPLDKEVTGRLPFNNLRRESIGWPSIRLTYWDEKDRHVQYSHYLSKSVPKTDKEFKFKFPNPGIRPGPALYILDVIEYPDEGRAGMPTVISNPVVVLVDIAGATATKMVEGKLAKGLVSDKAGSTFVEVVENVKFLSNRNFYFSKVPDDMRGGHLLMRPLDQANRWLPAGELTLTKPAIAFVGIVTRVGGKERIPGQQLVAFFNDGWKLAYGKFEATSPEGEHWQWEVLRKEIGQGPVSLTLPKGISKLDTPVIFYEFKPRP